MPLSPHKPLEQEGQEVGEGIELAVETNVLVAEFYAVFYVGGDLPSCMMPALRSHSTVPTYSRFRCENHKIPDSFASVSQNSEIIGQKKSDSLHRRPLQIFNRY